MSSLRNAKAIRNTKYYFFCLAAPKNQYVSFPTDLAWSQHIYRCYVVISWKTKSKVKKQDLRRNIREDSIFLRVHIFKDETHTVHPFSVLLIVNGFCIEWHHVLTVLHSKNIAFSSIQFALNAAAVKTIVFILCLWIFLQHKSCPN